MTDKRIVQGIEDQSMETLEAVFMDLQFREVECPECGDCRNLEPDATGTFDCECGVTVRIPTPAF